LSGDTIKFGATVTLVDEDTDKKAVYQIVGEVEADIKKGKISIASPLARALIGKKKGASVEVNTPGGAKAYEITKVERRLPLTQSSEKAASPTRLFVAPQCRKSSSEDAGE